MKKRRLVLFLTLMAVTSCVNEWNEDNTSEGTGEEVVEFALAPTYTSTRASIWQEDVVDELDLMVFKKGAFKYWRSASKDNTSETKDRFKATLTVDKGLDICFVANARAKIEKLSDEGKFAVGMSWEELQATLVDNAPEQYVFENSSDIKLPMFGILKNKDVVADQFNHWGPVKLLRSVASVDVQVGDAVDEDEFKLTKLYIYFAPDKGFLIPSLKNYNEDDGERVAWVKAPQSPADMQTNITLSSDATNKSIANKLYLFENSTLYQSTGENKHTRAVVGGMYQSQEYFYPIDFVAAEDTLERITRNWKYQFTVQSVTARGYETPEVASEEPPVGMNVSIVKWNETTGDELYVSGTFTLSIKSADRNVKLKPAKGASKQIGIESNIKSDQVTLQFATTGNGDTKPSDEGDGVKNEEFEVVKIADAKGKLTGLKIIALTPYNDTEKARNKDTLILTSGRIQIEISITQVNGDVDWEDGGDIGGDIS